MRHEFIIIILVHLLAVMPADAQNQRGRVELVDMDYDTAVFFAEGFSSNKRDAIENARINVLRRLLYDGVEGFNDDKPIVAGGGSNNLWLRDFFSGKNAPYKVYLGDVELIGDFNDTATGETHCNTYVVVKHEFLLRQAKIQGLTESEAVKDEKQNSENKPKPKKKFL